MQSKETDDVVGLIHRVRKRFYAYKVNRLASTSDSHSHAACSLSRCLPTLILLSYFLILSLMVARPGVNSDIS